MKLFVGLGNPGKEYEKTRHNVGFMVVDHLAKVFSATLNENTRFSGKFSKFGNKILLQPSTFMNESGRAVRAVVDYYNLEPTDIVLIYDDLDLELGSHKIQQEKYPKAHNGVNSVIQHLGTAGFQHVRLGIDSRDGDKTKPSDRYVLQPFSQEEKEKINTVIEEVSKSLLT